MTNETFEKIVRERCKKINNILAVKAKEYARGDRLHNFKRGAAALGQTKEAICIGFWMKHVVSILDMVDDIERGAPTASQNLWQEKIGDAINYLILLEALVKEDLR